MYRIVVFKSVWPIRLIIVNASYPARARRLQNGPQIVSPEPTARRPPTRYMKGTSEGSEGLPCFRVSKHIITRPPSVRKHEQNAKLPGSKPCNSSESRELLFARRLVPGRSALRLESDRQHRPP